MKLSDYFANQYRSADKAVMDVIHVKMVSHSIESFNFTDDEDVEHIVYQYVDEVDGVITICICDIDEDMEECNSIDDFCTREEILLILVNLENHIDTLD